MNRPYYLPNRKRAKSVEEYLDAWESLAKPLMELTGTTLHSFDPGVSLRGKGSEGIVQLPAWFLQAFNDNYERRLTEIGTTEAESRV